MQLPRLLTFNLNLRISTIEKEILTVAVEQGREVYAGVQAYRRKSRKETMGLEQKPVLKNKQLHINV